MQPGLRVTGAKSLQETRLRQEHGYPKLHSIMGKKGRLGRLGTQTSHTIRYQVLAPPSLPPTLLMHHTCGVMLFHLLLYGSEQSQDLELLILTTSHTSPPASIHCPFEVPFVTCSVVADLAPPFPSGPVPCCSGLPQISQLLIIPPSAYPASFPQLYYLLRLASNSKILLPLLSKF